MTGNRAASVLVRNSSLIAENGNQRLVHIVGRDSFASKGEEEVHQLASLVVYLCRLLRPLCFPSPHRFANNLVYR